MATRKNTAPRARVSRSDLYDILGQLGEARAILECAYVVLDDRQPGTESVCLRHGLDMLRDAYTELDTACLSGQARPVKL